MARRLVTWATEEARETAAAEIGRPAGTEEAAQDLESAPAVPERAQVAAEAAAGEASPAQKPAKEGKGEEKKRGRKGAVEKKKEKLAREEAERGESATREEKKPEAIPAPEQRADVAPAAEKKADAAPAAVEKFVFQFRGRDYTQEHITALVKRKCAESMGFREGDIRSLAMYAKPEDGRCYFVVNGSTRGEVDI